jgi:hypothetical protein
MNTFGTIKTKIENTLVKFYGNPEFKTFMEQFKDMVLENKDISELYYMYDDLSQKKGLHKDIATDYINESIEYSQILIENNENTLSKINKWVNSISEETENNYKDIDVTIYNKSIKNLESVLESKNRILKNIVSEEVKKEITESINLPLKTMLKVANDKLNKELSTISETERKEILDISTLTEDEIKEEMDTLKESVISNLKTTLSESKESGLEETIENTINKINSSKYDRYNLYKLRQLNGGL